MMTEEALEKKTNKIASNTKSYYALSYQTLATMIKINSKRLLMLQVDAHKDQRRKICEAYIFHSYCGS